MSSLKNRLERLKSFIIDKQSLLVSYSGGVDSTLLAVVAHEVLGDKMSCAIIKSPLMPKAEFSDALLVINDLNIPCNVLNSGILADYDFIKNQKDRCYVCKKKNSKLLFNEAKRQGLTSVADGTNFSDTKVFRPGFQAGKEAGIAHPFVDAEITKDDVRELARQYNLKNAEKPSASCLVTRFSYGSVISPEMLSAVEEAEDFIKSFGCGQVRVRCHGYIARIEVDPGDMGIILEKREEISENLKKSGFLYATLDLDGFVSGSMDREI
ncbi:ATP-dependent sacrificial sulfur transferase LarE [Methanoplanus sp. FWC-SCC4]|uniref:ATP-dependent sacrificial sulfur transferase LarE n=1 Tax=Methanochimaera problematica TaxID=2609417 RepID=A0AA97FBU7_9EURY|nr:ATP-dependent sacrificial sulfur transferase LarE [Methanoplanus sp. FWC-SCC4]WOF15188.1 ATP-dependent sacrificial sulfur transferase LarE [Methanoplanus sp. FWC-SCC4]